LLARIVVLENESPDGFAEVLTDHLERFQPADGVEFGITEEMVAAWWRVRRAWSIETPGLAPGSPWPPTSGPRPPSPGPSPNPCIGGPNRP
jgi:hypothetical protein